MVSVPVCRLTVAEIVWEVGSIVAMTSPGNPRPSSTARTSFPSGDSATERTRPVPLSGWLVEMVVVTACVVRLTTDTPPVLDPDVPAFATYRLPTASSTARLTGSPPTGTVLGVAEQPLVTLALQFATLK